MPITITYCSQLAYVSPPRLLICRVQPASLSFPQCIPPPLLAARSTLCLLRHVILAPILRKALLLFRPVEAGSSPARRWCTHTNIAPMIGIQGVLELPCRTCATGQEQRLDTVARPRGMFVCCNGGTGSDEAINTLCVRPL